MWYYTLNGPYDEIPNKWTNKGVMVVVGSSVSEERAAEIILRTTTLHGMEQHDRMRSRMAALYCNEKLSSVSNRIVSVGEFETWAKMAYRGCLGRKTTYNWKILSPGSGAPTVGWVSFNGTVGTRWYSFNFIAKHLYSWYGSNTLVVYTDEFAEAWKIIAANFPDLQLKAQLLNYQHGPTFSPLIDVELLGGGDVRYREATEVLIEPQPWCGSLDSWGRKRHGKIPIESDCTVKQLKTAVARAKKNATSLPKNVEWNDYVDTEDDYDEEDDEG